MHAGRGTLLLRLMVATLAVAACVPSADPGTPTSAPTSSATTPATTAPSVAGTEGSPTEAPLTAPPVPDLHPAVDDWPAGTVEVVVDDEVHRIAVRIAETPEQRAHGLMEVPDLPEGTGMWFVYPEEVTGAFWMKDTLVPLDIAFVGADGRIVSIADAVPCADQDPCPRYAPEGPYRHVLEVPAGHLDRIGAGVGTPVRLADR